MNSKLCSVLYCSTVCQSRSPKYDEALIDDIFRICDDENEFDDVPVSSILYCPALYCCFCLFMTSLHYTTISHTHNANITIS